jgi:4-hydroxybutyryl-CoA dehydratase/vinylacetyl-CoA-Delta-isomerase
MDALNALSIVTYNMDQKNGSAYHTRFLAYLEYVQENDLTCDGAMTDPKGDRSLPPHRQPDPDLYLRVVGEREDGIVVRGAKAHQTGAVNSHEIIVMPTMAMREEDRDYAVSFALPSDAHGILYIIGRQSCDTRSMEQGSLDVGNARFGGQEAMVIFDEVFIPNEHIFMDGECDFAAMLVERFTCYHRRSYVCKSGVGDVLIGAAAAIADYNGVEKASHIRDKLVEMTHQNETIYSTGIAASYQSQRMKSGVWQCDDMIANVCKHHVTRTPYELARLAQDLAGGLVVTLPSQQDLEHDALGPLLDKYLQGRAGISTEERVRILRLIENMTLGRNAVGYLTESMHGAGSPQAQRVQIARQAQLEFKKQLARALAGLTVESPDLSGEELEGYMARVFAPETTAPEE